MKVRPGSGGLNNLSWFLLSWDRDLFPPGDAPSVSHTPGGLVAGPWQSLKTGSSRSLSSFSFVLHGLPSFPPCPLSLWLSRDAFYTICPTFVQSELQEPLTWMPPQVQGPAFSFSASSQPLLGSRPHSLPQEGPGLLHCSSVFALPWLLGLELAHPCLLPFPVQEDTHSTRCKASASELPPLALFLVTF